MLWFCGQKSFKNQPLQMHLKVVEPSSLGNTERKKNHKYKIRSFSWNLNSQSELPSGASSSIHSHPKYFSLSADLGPRLWGMHVKCWVFGSKVAAVLSDEN